MKKLTAILGLSIVLGGVVARGAPERSPEVRAAFALWESRRMPEAKEAFDRILAQTPDQPEANYARGLIACEQREWEAALGFAEKALKSDLNDARYHYGWGAANGTAALKAGVLSKFGYARKCLAAYQRAVELAPREIRYRRALMDYYRQAPGLVGGGMEKAYAQAAEIKRLDAEAGRQAMARLYVGEKKYAEAFREYEDVLKAEPDNYPAWFSFGMLAVMTGERLEEGTAAFERCLALAPPAGSMVPGHPTVHFQLGRVWEKRADPEKARAAYREALRLFPGFRAAEEALQKLEPTSDGTN